MLHLGFLAPGGAGDETQTQFTLKLPTLSHLGLDPSHPLLHIHNTAKSWETHPRSHRGPWAQTHRAIAPGCCTLLVPYICDARGDFQDLSSQVLATGNTYVNSVHIPLTLERGPLVTWRTHSPPAHGQASDLLVVRVTAQVTWTMRLRLFSSHQ